jgi:hypothetical protein
MVPFVTCQNFFTNKIRGENTSEEREEKGGGEYYVPS